MNIEGTGTFLPQLRPGEGSNSRKGQNKMKKLYMVNTRNNEIVTVSDKNESGKIAVTNIATNETREVSPATIRRWFKVCEAPKAEKATKVNGEKTFAPLVEGHAANIEGGSVYKMNVAGRKSLKVNGHMYAALRYSSKGVEIWLRSAPYSAEDLEGLQIKKANHMFDIRVKFNQLEGNEATITWLLDGAMTYQMEKKDRKAQKGA